MPRIARLLALVLAGFGCSGSPVNVGGTGTTTTSSSGAGSSSGTTTGGTGGLAAGAACTANEQCTSFACGVFGSGHCCVTQCVAAGDMACDPIGCDVNGACVHSPGNPCGVTACSGNMLTTNACNAAGACQPQTPSACPDNRGCDDAGTSCLTSCTTKADCASGFVCNGGACVVPQATGACTSNEDCTSGICGISGRGHCCTGPTACLTADTACGASDCDNTGACAYPDAGTVCASPSTCTGGEQFGPLGICSGSGTCSLTTVNCSPYNCGAQSCVTTCTASTPTGSTSCVDGGFCDNMVCCAGLEGSGTLRVDGVLGNDSTPCCGLGANEPCQTLTRAMAIIASAQAKNMTIDATVDGGGGDWAPVSETYPIVLGWGVELNAPGVFFYDPSGSGNSAILDVQVYPGDSLGYASIVGAGTTRIGVGMDQANVVQLADLSAISVEPAGTLYIANALVNGSFYGPAAYTFANAIDVHPGGSVVLGQDQSGGVSGTVYIGNAVGSYATDGWIGINCESDAGAGLGCTVTDAQLVGQSSVVIQGQLLADINANDFAAITITSAPVFGVTPAGPGFQKCPFKHDGLAGGLPGSPGGPAISIVGQASMTISNATIQCVPADGVAMGASPSGAPSLNLTNSTIQNAGRALYASAGSVTMSGSTIWYNGRGIQQATATDGFGNTTNATVDLSGDGLSDNTIICNSSNESPSYGPGIGVYNTSNVTLNASNVAWDTPSPDYFTCDSAFASCTCNLSSCVVDAGSDGMDAVEDATNLGGITTTGNTISGYFLDAGCH